MIGRYRRVGVPVSERFIGGSLMIFRIGPPKGVIVCL